MRCQFRAESVAHVDGVGKTAAAVGERRAVADHELRSGQVEELLRPRPEQVGVDPAAPQLEVAEAARLDGTAHRGRRH